MYICLKKSDYYHRGDGEWHNSRRGERALLRAARRHYESVSASSMYVNRLKKYHVTIIYVNYVRHGTRGLYQDKNIH